MNLGLHAIAQGGIDQLMPCNESLALKEWANDNRLEVVTVTVDRDVVTAEAGLNVVLNVLWSDHAAILGGIGQNAPKGLLKA
ncbi:MAG: hypothetical protein RL446_263 [Pseudomonadota bacterium]|jgi:hypothetical protein